MLSTSTSFNLVNRDLQASLRRVAADPIVSRDAQYYRDNIASVTSVDDFVDNYRLFSYAMKAYGLEDMTYAKAFMKKVLTSDLSDEKSFANKLADHRYKEFAAAFNFGTDGEVKAVDFESQSTIQEDDTIGLYTQSVEDALKAVDTETAYYETAIDQVTSVDDFLANSRLVEFALKAAGIDPTYYSQDTLRRVLTSDLSDPQSYANQLGSDEYLSLARDFNFQTDGSLAAGTPAQTADQKNGLIADYAFFVADGTTPQMAQDNTDYFIQQTAAITSVDDIINDSRLYNYLLTAFGFDVFSTDKASIRAALISDPSDPASFANTQTDTNFARLAGLFNFEADGTVTPGQPPRSDEQLTAMTSLYVEHYDDALESRSDNKTAYFKAASQHVDSVDDLINDSQLYKYVLQAYGLDPETESKRTIRRILTSDTSDPTSYVNILRDPRYRELAEAFNFNPDGSVGPSTAAQATRDIQATETAYAELAKSGEITKEEAEAETKYYDDAILRVGSLDDFLADERLVSYALMAGGVDPETVDTATLRKLFTSDLSDPESFANRDVGKELRDVAARFNFLPDGSIGDQAASSVQTRADILETADKYLRQTLEENEGEENTGVRLALYFERTAPGISSAYDILADPALQQVVQVALGLAPETSATDVDAQAKYIEDHLDVTDFKDPEKLQKFLTLFTSMYDVQNGTSFDPSLVLLSGGSATIGISTDLMLSIAQLPSGGLR